MRKRCKHWVLLLTLGLMPAAALAVDLLQAYSDALVNDATVLAASERLKETSELIPQAYAVLLPQSTLNAETATGRVRGSSYVGTQNRQTSDVNLNITQSLFNLADWFNVSRAKSSVKQAQAEYLAVAQNLLVRTTSAYLAILQAQDNLRFTRDEVKAFEQQLNQAKERHKVGIDPITNVYDAQARYDSARAREIEARNAIQNRFEDLRVITGHRYTHVCPIRAELPLIKPNPTNIDVWEATAEEHNFTIKAQEFALMAAKSNIKVEAAGHYPEVNLFADLNDIYLSRAGTGTNKLDDQEAYLGLRLQWSLLQGGAVLSRTRAARYAWAAVLQDLEQARRDAVNNVRQSYNNVNSRIIQIGANRQAIISNKSSLESTQEAFKVGTRTIVDVLDAQQELTRAQQEHAISQYQYLINRVELKEAAGILTINDLEEINSWLVKNKMGYEQDNQRKVATKT